MLDLISVFCLPNVVFPLFSRWCPQDGNRTSVAVVCHLVACTLHNHELTKLYLDQRPSDCVVHDAWKDEGLPVPPREVVAGNWDGVLKFIRDVSV